ncbi:MAG: hypothetical protein AAB819_01845 [Patescibacteria group bacterium]
MESLQKLFGGAAPVRVMRLFLLNPETVFEAGDVAKKAGLSSAAVRREIQKLISAKMIVKKTTLKEMAISKRGQRKKNTKIKKRRISGFILNQSFAHLPALRMLVAGANLIEKKRVVSRLGATGNIKLLVLSGVFLRAGEPGRIDALVVGENLHNKKLDRAFHAIESDMGKELQYAAMDPREFTYRFNMHDKFLRDIFDYPHEKLVNKLGV